MRSLLLLSSLFLLFIDSGQALAAGSSNSFNVGLRISNSSSNAFNARAKFTCNAAKVKVQIAGYTNPKVITCDLSPYKFVAFQNETQTTILFDASNGLISTTSLD